MGLSSLVVVTSLFMPWAVAPSGLFGSGSETHSAFSLAWAVAVEDELEIFLYFVLAPAIICLGIIVIVMVGLTRGGRAVWGKVSVLFLSLVVLLTGFFAFSLALGASAERPREFEVGFGIFIFALGSLMTFSGCLWGDCPPESRLAFGSVWLLNSAGLEPDPWDAYRSPGAGLRSSSSYRASSARKSSCLFVSGHCSGEYFRCSGSSWSW